MVLPATERTFTQEVEMADQDRISESDCSERKKTTAPGRNSWKLAWLAETADGWRDEKLKLVLHAKDGLSLQRADYQPGPGEQVVCLIETPSCQPGREQVLRVTLDTKNAGSHTVDTKEGWDAVFWTESAIEKFLYPYYHSQRLWSDELEDLKTAFETYPGAFAIRHKAPSASEVMSLASTVEIGAMGMDLKPRWYPLQHFMDLAQAHRVAKGGAKPEAAGRGQGTR
jgi:hypothetical protein